MVGETAKRKRAPFLALFVMVMILLHTSHCGATISIMKDNASSPYHARMDEAADWMFDSEITRMLADKPHTTDGYNNPNKPVVNDCNRPPKYKTCLDKINGRKPPPDCRGIYGRNC